MKLSQTDLGKLLDISQSLVSRYARQGMPTQDAKAARAWIRGNVGLRIKTPLDRLAKTGYRRRAPPSQTPSPADLDVCDAFEHLAFSAKHESIEPYLPALLKLLDILDTDELDELRQRGEVAQVVWDAIDTAIDDEQDGRPGA